MTFFDAAALPRFFRAVSVFLILFVSMLFGASSEASSARAPAAAQGGGCSAASIGLPGSTVTYDVHELRGQLYDGGRVHLRRRVGGTWSNFGGPIAGDFDWQVSEMSVYQDRLVVRGRGIDTAGGETVSNLMTWDGTAFALLGRRASTWAETRTSFGGSRSAGSSS